MTDTLTLILIALGFSLLLGAIATVALLRTLFVLMRSDWVEHLDSGSKK